MNVSTCHGYMSDVSFVNFLEKFQHLGGGGVQARGSSP